jgi:hypothetical protein
MALEIAGNVPTPYPLVKTYVNRAWLDVQRKCMWSFLWGDAAIPTPASIGAGTVTVTLGSTTVTPDATALAAWLSAGLVNPLTTLQFRIGMGTIYNIIAFPGNTAITLDKPFVDPPGGAGLGYQIYGVYFNAPCKDFLWWESVRDPVTGYAFDLTKTRQEVDEDDPQRLQVGWPVAMVPYQINPCPGSFLQYPMYEMWPAPLNNLTYVGTYFRSGMPFVNLTDTVTAPLQEDVVIECASMKAYEWCLANPDKCPKSDWRFSIGRAQKRYNDLINDYMKMDEEFSGRNIIPSSQVVGRYGLPWCSQKEMVASWPDW